MFLVIDVGNTNTVFALYEIKSNNFKLLNSFRISTDLKRTADEYFFLLNQSFNINVLNISKLSGASIASVVPEVMNNIEVCFKNNLKIPLFTTEVNKLNIKIEIENPKEAGQDRLINAFAVKKLKLDPAIIIDFGTATTFDIIGKGGSYLGGIIAPGINLSVESLYKATSRLPKILIKPLNDELNTLIGKNTVAAIESGVFWGYVCMIEGLINKLKKYHNNTKIIATGGLSQIFKNKIKLIDIVEQDLTLKGLAYFYMMQEKKNDL